MTFLTTARQFARRNAYRGGKWTLNGPAIVLLLIMYSPRGLARVTVSLSRYLYDWDSAQVRHQHAGNTETPEYVKAQNIRKANLKARWMVASAVTVATVGPVLAWTAPNALAWIVAPVLFVWIVKMIPGKEFWEYIVAFGSAALVWWKLPHWLALVPDPPWWLLPAIGTAAVLTLGWVGRPKGKDLLKDSRAGLPSELVKPTAEMVVDALIRTGIPGMSLQNAERIHEETRIIAPGVATSSHGYILEMELPPGITTEMVAARRPSFAAALRRDLSMVWPAGLPEKHPGYLRLFLSHQPMNKAKQPTWPIAAGKPIDVFEPIPMFTDEQCRWVNITLAGTHMVMGGASGSGKSVGLRQLGVALAFALNTKIVVFDGKRNGDLEPIRDLCHAYFEGAEPEEIEEQLQCLRWLVTERAKRAKFLSSLPRDIRQPKVTPELAARFPAQLSPIAVLIDECQEHTEYGIKGNRDDKKTRDEFVALYTKLSRLARSVGIMLVFVSQKPDASVLPSAIMGNCGIRVAFRVSEQVHNDQILGTSARKNGIDATTFSLHERGMAWVRGGETADTMVARTWSDMVELEPAHELAAKAYRLRKEAGLLTGQAAGEDDETAAPKANLLDDIRDVMDNPAGQVQPASRMHLATIVEALQLVRPGAWDHLDAESLGGMLRKAGVFVGQVKIGNRNTSGIRRQDLDLRVPADELVEAG